MQISKPNNMEELKIDHFVVEDTGLRVNTLVFSVPFKTSTFAVAAMLKGLEEFYFKPADLKMEDEELSKATEHNLRLWSETNQNNKKSSLIIE